jgi:pSer/pThr/pTyr-binding forkhead associated (FHA) protein
MTAALVGVQGQLAGQRYPIGESALSLGRAPDSGIVVTDPAASRRHAEIRREGSGYVLHDLGSGNGTWVNGGPVTTHRLEPGDQILIGEESFRFEVVGAPAVLGGPGQAGDGGAKDPVLRVTIAGGGPVGMATALMLDDLMGPRVAITICDGRWHETADRKIYWQNPEQGNNRRLQVVTVQSRQYRKLPQEVQDRLFQPGTYTEMWPMGPDSIDGYPPRNIRIAYIEDELLAILNEKRDRIRMVPENFDPEAPGLDTQHVLAICEGGKSSTRQHFIKRFGTADEGVYGLDGQPLHDMVLGLRVKSQLSDPMAVLITVTQNRFLLNALRGEGFLNMRLSANEELEAVGINPVRQVFTPCIQSTPCFLERQPGGEFLCEGHHAVFLPALLKGSALWNRVQEGLKLFAVADGDLTAVTGFKLDMNARPRFTAEVLPRTATRPGTFAFLLGDSANAIHFWPGRGLNSGLASAISFTRCIASVWRGAPLRDSDFTRHEANMAMLQYRHKTRAYRQMVTNDEAGIPHAIKDLIAQGTTEGEAGGTDRAADMEIFMERLRRNRSRLEKRLPGMPDDDTLRSHLEQMSSASLHTFVVSDVWDSGNVGGEEVDVDWLLPAPDGAAVPQPRAPQPAAAAEERMPRGWEPVAKV